METDSVTSHMAAVSKAVTLTSTDIGSQAVESSSCFQKHNVRCAQQEDEEIASIVQWIEKSNTRPSWDEVSSENEVTKIYWAQWQNLKLQEWFIIPT